MNRQKTLHPFDRLIFRVLFALPFVVELVPDIIRDRDAGKLIILVLFVGGVFAVVK